MTTQWHQAPSTKIYFDTTFNTRAARILPGEYHATKDDMVIVTVLGSCVAACVRDPASGIGGMNHFLLPDGSGNEDEATSARYGVYAMEVLINQLIKMHARRDRLEAKAFGGASVIPGMNQLNIGQRNAKFVLDFLRMERIPVVSSDLEDTCPRKVAFFPRTGLVKMKRLIDTDSQQLAKRERSYKAELKKAPIAGAVELFG